MVRNLTTLVLAGALGMMVFSGNAQACHKRSCRSQQACAAPAPCAPRVKTCGFHMPKFCHKRTCAPRTCAPTPCAGPVCPTPQAACASPVYAAPQASGQY